MTSVDSASSSGGDVVYAGSVVDPESKQPIGSFLYSNFLGSSPYLSVNMPFETYEVFENALTPETDFVLKYQTDPVFHGQIDLDDEEYEQLFQDAPSTRSMVERKTDMSGQRGSARSGSCVVDIGVGYTSAALSRNGSIVSAIGSWVSNLNALINSVGVTCDYRLVGTLAATYTETSSIFTDIFAIKTNAQITNWKNNTVNADVFVLISSAGSPPVLPSDIYEGIALVDQQPACQTIYVTTAKCGEFAIVRDDYAISIYVFAHEVVHLAGARHSYAYGGGTTAYGGNGFTAQSNGTEDTVSSNAIESTTLMSNPPPSDQCSTSTVVIDRTDCGNRLPYFASQTASRVVYEVGSFPSPSYRYFPDFYPNIRTLAYGVSTPSMRGVIQNGMTILKNNQ